MIANPDNDREALFQGKRVEICISEVIIREERKSGKLVSNFGSAFAVADSRSEIEEFLNLR